MGEPWPVTYLPVSAVIEQAKGMSRHSQTANHKLRAIAAGLMTGEIDPAELVLSRRRR